MARRGHGEGSIYQRKDGRWTAALTLEDHRRKTFYGKTRKEVQDKLNAALHEQKQGMLSTGPQQTLRVYLERWLEQVCKPTMRPNTYQTYRFNLSHHVIPSLGHIKLQKLTPEQVQAFYVQKQHEGLKPRSIAVVHMALSSALDNAVKWGLVARNVAKLTTLPRIERYEAQILTVEQAYKLLQVARGSRIEVLLLVALTTGMRRGELLALRWGDIDFEQCMLYVRRTVSPIVGAGYVEGDPKTKAGRRKIALPDVVIEALKEHRERQEKARIEAGEKWRDLGIVFCNLYGDFYDPGGMRRKFKKLLRDAGLPDMRFHDLRHSAAMVLAAAQVDLKTAQERLGHGSIATTADIYMQVTMKMQQEAVKKLNEFFKR